MAFACIAPVPPQPTQPACPRRTAGGATCSHSQRHLPGAVTTRPPSTTASHSRPPGGDPARSRADGGAGTPGPPTGGKPPAGGLRPSSAASGLWPDGAAGLCPSEQLPAPRLLTVVPSVLHLNVSLAGSHFECDTTRALHLKNEPFLQGEAPLPRLLFCFNSASSGPLPRRISHPRAGSQPAYRLQGPLSHPSRSAPPHRGRKEPAGEHRGHVSAPAADRCVDEPSGERGCRVILLLEAVRRLGGSRGPIRVSRAAWAPCPQPLARS